MHATYRFRFTDAITTPEIAQRLFLAALNTENVFGEATMRLDASFRLSRQTRICEIDRDTEVGRHIAKLFVAFISAEFGDDCYTVERIEQPT